MTEQKLTLKAVSEPAKRMVWAEVYAPNRPDTDGEWMSAETIEKMAYAFMRSQRTKKVDVQHDNGEYDGIDIIESFVARKGDPDFIEGSWVVGVHINNDDIWSQVEKGEINGFSVEALVTKRTGEVEVEIPPVVTGRTTKSEDHEHTFMVAYDDEGRFLGGKTDVVDGHMHVIKNGTITEEAKGHMHRYSAVDDVVITPVQSST